MNHLQQYYEACYNAYRNLSFDPKKRAERAISDYGKELDQDIETLIALKADAEQYKKKYIELFLKWMYSQSNCASAAITGPSRFPSERMKKRSQWADNHYNNFRSWRERCLKAIERKANRIEKPKSEKENKEISFDGGKVILNYEIDRIQIKHDERPPQIIIALLKSRAFRWSPFHKAWQRQLTDNAKAVTESILKIKI